MELVTLGCVPWKQTVKQIRTLSHENPCPFEKSVLDLAHGFLRHLGDIFWFSTGHVYILQGCFSNRSGALRLLAGTT